MYIAIFGLFSRATCGFIGMWRVQIVVHFRVQMYVHLYTILYSVHLYILYTLYILYIAFRLLYTAFFRDGRSGKHGWEFRKVFVDSHTAKTGGLAHLGFRGAWVGGKESDKFLTLLLGS